MDVTFPKAFKIILFKCTDPLYKKKTIGQLDQIIFLNFSSSTFDLRLLEIGCVPLNRFFDINKFSDY